jgi:hypothetical protein
VARTILAVFTLLVAGLASSSLAAQTPDVAEQMRKMENTRLAFPKISSRWADDLADNALFMQGTGVMLNKQQTIENYKNGSGENSTELTETEFRQAGTQRYLAMSALAAGTTIGAAQSAVSIDESQWSTAQPAVNGSLCF